MKDPIFEILDNGKHYKIWADGRVEGFSENAIISNAIPVVLDYVFVRARHDLPPTKGEKSSVRIGLSQLLPP